MNFFLRLLAITAFCLCLCADLSAAPSVRQRQAEFRVPEGLRGRVDFWIDVFARYGKNQVVIHHRNYPQAVFGVLDLRQAAQDMGPVQLSVYKKKREKELIAQVEGVLTGLAGGRSPDSAFERHVQTAMRLVPGGPGKYREAVKEGLVRSQTGIREKYAEAVRRSGRYMHILERIFVRDYGLPVELTRLPFIESSFDYQAYSSVGAAGIWQFMRSTGRKYMTINNVVDERRDVIASTRAAARYLQHAYNSLGSWPLAITSYNHGVAGVARKVRQLGTSNIVELVEHPRERLFGFASSNFYPEFLAALEVYDRRREYFPEVREEAPVHISEHHLKSATSAEYAAKKLGVSLETLRELNTALSDKIWKGAARIPAGYSLKIPGERSYTLAELQTPEPSPVERTVVSSAAAGSTYKVKPGDTLYGIARKYNTSAQALQKLNGLKAPRIRVGQVLQISGSAEREIATEKSQSRAASAVSAAPQVLRKKNQEADPARTHVVRDGESLWIIARKYKVKLESLRKVNGLKDSRVKPGQKLVIP